MIQATVSTYLTRHEVVDSELTREDEIEEQLPPGVQAPLAEGVFSRLSSKLRREEPADRGAPSD